MARKVYLWTLPYHLHLFSQIDAFKGALQKFLVMITKMSFSELSSYFGMIISYWFLWYFCLFSSLLISTCKAHKPRETQGTHCSTLASIYLYKYERSAFFSSILLYVYWSFCLKKKIKTVRHLSFAKSFSLLIFLIIFCVRMGFNGFFSLFCQVLVGFWWVPMMVLTEKNYTYICEENSNRASNKVFFFV